MIPPRLATIAYVRDATDRLVRHDATAGDPQATVLYGYTDSGDAADLTFGADKRLLSRTLALPGGVVLTFTYPGGVATPEYDHVTIRGDICLSTDTTGKQAGPLYSYDPFGQPLRTDGTIDPQAVPANQPGKMNYGWLGQHQRPYEHAGALSLVEMGARPYSPLLGRFLSVDPVEGGNANDYIYPTDHTDLDGKWSIGGLFHAAYSWAQRHPAAVHMVVNMGVGAVASLGAAAFCGATAGLGCVVIAGAYIGAVAGGFANVMAARAIHEPVTRRKVVTWMAKGAVSGGYSAVRGTVGLSNYQVFKAGRRFGVRSQRFRTYLRFSHAMLRSRRMWRIR